MNGGLYMNKITIELDEDVYEKLVNIVNYYNQYVYLHNKDWELHSIEDIVKGSVIREIERIETYNPRQVDYGERRIDKGLLKNNLKHILKKLNIKQLDLAEMTGIDRSNLSLIMNNRNQPSADYLLRIHAALNYYPLDQLFYREKKGR
jgi:DNA-binding Xre family transcriptional regulator